MTTVAQLVKDINDVMRLTDDWYDITESLSSLVVESGFTATYVESRNATHRCARTGGTEQPCQLDVYNLGKGYVGMMVGDSCAEAVELRPVPGGSWAPAGGGDVV